MERIDQWPLTFPDGQEYMFTDYVYQLCITVRKLNAVLDIEFNVLLSTMQLNDAGYNWR